jgi:imidazole glycerol-phosphate synthase subunit HisH
LSAAVTVVDFGAGNLLSMARALRRCGAEVELAEDAATIARAERLVLPGVGAFGDAMDGLHARRLDSAVLEFLDSGRPFLGICVGMQMMLDSSEEFGRHQGLAAIAGKVRAIPKTGGNGRPHKIPHIGWNALAPAGTDDPPGWSGTILAGIEQDACVYFVHSYTAWPTDEAARLADACYDGRRIAAVLRTGNAYGCQFHPEKSGPVGLEILQNFMTLT